MAREILFTADDLGLDEATNLAIEDAHRRGVLNSASLMLGQPGTGHAVGMARRNPSLQVGFHFHACDSRPVTRSQWPWGRSATRAGIFLAVSPGARQLLHQELVAQWQAFLDTGLTCAFLNGHHHLHVHPFIARELHRQTTASFRGWVRGFEARFFDGRGSPWHHWLGRRAARWLGSWPSERRTDSLWGLDRTFCMKADEIARVIRTLPDGRHEFMFHPRRIGDADHRALLELKSVSPGLPNSSRSL
jgi:predicted glycoside hydrolase/deacetylase ChbG (UPF0249 family)